MLEGQASSHKSKKRDLKKKLVLLVFPFTSPEWALILIHTQLAKGMRNEKEGHTKIGLAKWPSVCMKKVHVCLGIPNL
jgi:hypothetical protein